MSKESNGKTSGGDIPKIQLETKEDALFLHGQFASFLSKTTESNTSLRDGPYTPAQRSEAKALILSTLQDWSTKVWETAGANISVNGFPYHDAMQEQSKIEPLNEQLKNEVEALREQAEALLLAVAEKRQTVPRKIEGLVKDVVWRESLVAESTTEKVEEELDGELPFVEDRVNGEFQEAVRVAKRLGESVPRTVREVERLKGVVEDTRERVGGEQEEDEKARWTLYAREQGKKNGGERADAQALAYRAALHAVSND